MNILIRRSPDEVRASILKAAWDLFRQLGSRATIADVADVLGMSSANIYRFFPSKQALMEAVCANQLGEMHARAQASADESGAPSQRIRATIMTLFELMRDQMTNQQRVHEVVDIALNEQWPAIDNFLAANAALLAGLVQEGQAMGEFGPGDPAQLGLGVLQACAALHHPHMIAECFGETPRADADAIIDFALRALGNQHPAPSAASEFPL